MAARVVEGGDRDLQGDEVVRADEAADAEPGVERADRADRQHPVAARLGQRAQVGRVVDPVGEDVGVGAAVALQRIARVLRAAAAISAPPGPAAPLPRMTARRPTTPILWRVRLWRIAVEQRPRVS